MGAARSRLEIAADNLANASTDGFRRHAAVGVFSSSGVRIERNESTEQGALHRTGRSFDLALIGEGAFSVRDRRGVVSQTRNGSYTRDRWEHLKDDAGRLLLGARGPIRVPEGASVATDGSIRKDAQVVDRIGLPAGTSLRSGFIETANVNAISEMIDVLAAQRSFESAQKVLSAIDGTRQKTSDELARLK